MNVWSSTLAIESKGTVTETHFLRMAQFMTRNRNVPFKQKCLLEKFDTRFNN